MTPTKPQGPTFWDVESGPLPDEEIAKLIPNFNAPSNYKKQDKIDAYIESQRKQWRDRAALSALTGEVLAIGLLHGDTFTCLGEQGEPEGVIIDQFWDRFDSDFNAFVGFNIRYWDLPFLVRRSFKLGVGIPSHVREGRWWSSRMVDLMDSWSMGDRYESSVGLDKLSQFLGVGEKIGNGAQFAGLWLASKEAAKGYLLNDLKLIKACHHVMHGRTRKIQMLDEDRL